MVFPRLNTEATTMILKPGTQEIRFKMSNEDVFKILLTKQLEDMIKSRTAGFWIATALFVKDGVVGTHNECGDSKQEAYDSASAWILECLDPKAGIELLDPQ
jgi:hypothetical protein